MAVRFVDERGGSRRSLLGVVLAEEVGKPVAEAASYLGASFPGLKAGASTVVPLCGTITCVRAATGRAWGPEGVSGKFYFFG